MGEDQSVNPMEPTRIPRPDHRDGNVTLVEEHHISHSNAIRDVYIKQLNRGYVVNVGCHSFAFSTKEEMMEKITAYINSPAETEKMWYKGELF